MERGSARVVRLTADKLSYVHMGHGKPKHVSVIAQPTRDSHKATTSSPLIFPSSPRPLKEGVSDVPSSIVSPSIDCCIRTQWIHYQS